MSLGDAINLLREVYASTNNDHRKGCTLQLLQWEKALQAADAVRIGIELLKTSNEGVAVQAYGAVLLRHALHARVLQPAQLPLMDLLSWYCNEPTLGPLLRADLMELLIECVIYSDDAVIGQVLGSLCTGIESQPRRMLLLSEMTVALVDPDFDRVPRESIGKLKRSVTKQGSQLLNAATMSLYTYYVTSGGEQSTALAPDLEPCVEAAFKVIGTLAPQLPFSAWQENNLAATMEVLLRWVPAQRPVLTCATSLLRCYSAGDVSKAAILRVLLSIVLRKIPALVASGDIAALDEILNLALELPKDFVQLEGVLLVQSIMSVFSVPSILFGQEAVQLMERMGEETFRHVDAIEIYNGLRLLLPKNLCHPVQGTNPEGQELSREQFGFEQLFEEVFADFRRGASKILTQLARMYPERTNQYLLSLLGDLPDPRGTPGDPRTRSRFVRQSSLTFVCWEATQFMMEYLSAAFEYSTVSVNACVSTLLAHEPSDAVLRPVYFNMISYFWKVRDGDVMNVWEGTINILLNCINDESSRYTDDIDVSAARRRAHTLLVQMCVEHSRRFLPRTPSLIKQLEPMLMRANGMERSLLYEALIALTAVLPAHESDAYLQTIVNPLVNMLATSPALKDQNAFNNIMCAGTPDDKDARGVLQGCLNTIAAVFRRCQMTPYVIEKATQLFPLIGQLLLSIHSMQPSDLPPEYRSILEQEPGERDLFLPGKTRKSDAHLVNTVRGARATLMNIRIALYQVFGELSPILPAERFGEVITALTTSAQIPTHVTRSLTEKCLLPIGKEHPTLLIYIFQLLHRFFAQRKEQVRRQRTAEANARNTRDDVVESKQWLYYAKDVTKFIRSHVLDSHLWKRDKALFLATAEVAMSIFESGADNRTAQSFLISIVNLTTDTAVLPEVEAALSEVRVVVYSRLVSYVTLTPDGELTPCERENVAYAISEPYVRLFPNLTPSLTMAGISQEQQETLNAHLLIVGNFAGQRRKVKEFLINIAKADAGASGRV
ncbi:hypothetical protein, conserved [Leishmania donovani]|uniref:Uncharacterized protein n=1 Tax=Leishmania donovani TaxID=5661 RepID=E9BTZ0_LEIDO|nr:hypothetical protein, conserved [Leishmania donovani]TPP48390.1 hypothetical protein CGC21_13700 [Leishmania donovani]CBZ38719.1 hypothetical protein, conserved [Leishmania donovani]